MANAWLAHVKKTMKQMKSKGTYAKGKGLGQVIKEAKKTWHSSKGTSKTMKKSRRHRKGGAHPVCDQMTYPNESYESRGECIQDQK
jgi:hypothetical protein